MLRALPILNCLQSLAGWPVEIAAAAALATEPSKLESCILLQILRRTCHLMYTLSVCASVYLSVILFIL